MPNMREHNLATLAGATISSATMTAVGFPASETIAMTLGFLVTFFINPDLDLNRRFPKQQPHKWLWWVFWYPYSRLLAHRSVFSHFPVVGTLTRVGYVATFVTVIIVFINAQISVPDAAIYIIAGMCLSDLVHFVMDMI